MAPLLASGAAWRRLARGPHRHVQHHLQGAAAAAATRPAPGSGSAAAAAAARRRARTGGGGAGAGGGGGASVGRTAHATRSAVVVLPGFGNVAADYAAPFDDESDGLVAALERRGFDTAVVQLAKRTEWAQILRGVLAPVAFVRGTSTVDPAYTWYLDLVHEAALEAARSSPTGQVTLVGHSAGGWLARAYIGMERYGASRGAPNPLVDALVTLGTPHEPPPDGTPDQTRGALRWVCERWPGATFSDSLVYVSVTGRAVRADATQGASTLEGYANISYSQLVGDADKVEGDAVVPNCIAALDGGDAHLVLDDVFHSMSKVGTYDTRGEPPWYGSEEVIDAWLDALATALEERRAGVARS